MEEFEELKSMLVNKIQNREIPEEVKREINEIYKRMHEIMEYYNAMNSTLKDCILENQKMVNNILNNNITNERKDGQLEELSYVLKSMERKLEEEQQNSTDNKMKEAENNREKQTNITSFEEMDMHSQETVSKIVRVLEDNVSEIMNKARRILDSRGVSWDKIHQVDTSLKRVIYDLDGKIPDNLMTILEKDDKEIISEMIGTYEEYEEYKKQKEKEEQGKQEALEGNTNNRDKFVEDLNAGISLEKQNKFAKEFHNRESSDNARSNKDKDENDVQSLPDDILK